MSAPRDFAPPRILAPALRHAASPPASPAARLAVLAIAAPTPYKQCLHYFRLADMEAAACSGP
jgi:hypothetical protein